MPDFNVRSDAVNVEQIMEQIRARIREKRGVDYTEAQIRELASVKLEKFLDPRGVRSDLLEQYRKAQPPYAPPELPNFAFEENTLFESTRGPLNWIRKLLMPVLKLFFNPNPLIQALHIQSKLNSGVAEREAKRDAARYAFDSLHYEVMHNLVVEITRLGIEMKNMTMRLESLSSRLEFNERRARALESVVVYKADDEPPAREEQRPARPESRRQERPERQERQERPDRPDRADRQERRGDHGQRRQPPPAATQVPAPAPPQESGVATAAETDAAAVSADTPAPPPQATEGPGQRSRRRRRRRGRRGSGAASALMAGGTQDVTGSDEGLEDGDANDSGDTRDGSDIVQDALLASPGSDAVRALPAPAPDSRVSRPEPFEHTFGARAHPAELTAQDPNHTAPAPATPVVSETASAPRSDAQSRSEAPPSSDPSSEQ